jgi:hypothetical protein
MPLEDPDVIDVITKPAPNKLELIITDAGLTPDPRERLEKLVAKLKSYINYILGGQFAEDHPLLGPEDVSIAVVCATPPTPEMLNITHVKPRTVQEWFIAVRFLQFAGGKFTPWEREELEEEVDHDRILPRLVTEDFVGRASADNEFPHRPLGDTGLFVAYVVDGENTVRFIMGPLVEAVGLGEEELYEVALANLGKTFNFNSLRESLPELGITTVKCQDTYDAVRLLLIPQDLRPGEAIAALVPDRDTLTLVSAPADGNWAPLAELAKIPASEHLLLDRPLKVTCEGFEVM